MKRSRNESSSPATSSTSHTDGSNCKKSKTSKSKPIEYVDNDTENDHSSAPTGRVSPPWNIMKIKRTNDTWAVVAPTPLQPKLLPPSDKSAKNGIPTSFRPMPSNVLAMNNMIQPAKQPTYLSEAEVLCASTTSKSSRTKVYSGAKSGAAQTNASGVLRPALDSATADELSRMEDRNPHIKEQTDTLWERHVRNKFRNAQRRETETWRETYMRCGKEINTKLASLTSRLAMNHSAAPTGRKIQVMEIEVKPPRDILKLQKKNGTGNIVVSTPAARVASLSKVLPNIASAGGVRSRILAAWNESIPERSKFNGVKSSKGQ